MLAELARAVEARDPYSRGHSSRVTTLAVRVARRLGWSARRIAAIELGGLLHDVGKLGVSIRVLRKPATLTARERAQIELHPTVGVQLVESIDPARPARSCILHHHERWDGAGYPHGLAGEEIPVEARLLAIADAFDAMTSERAYRRALSTDAALAELERCAGSQFDPKLVAAFVAVWADAR
jgi:HD-GYP domain-containing protein (c-di-GMP phosphodiesterase class II)